MNTSNDFKSAISTKFSYLYVSIFFIIKSFQVIQEHNERLYYLHNKLIHATLVHNIFLPYVQDNKHYYYINR